MVTLFPLWLAPNLITLLGTGGLVVGYMVSAYYLPEFQGAPPARKPALVLPPFPPASSLRQHSGASCCPQSSDSLVYLLPTSVCQPPFFAS